MSARQKKKGNRVFQTCRIVLTNLGHKKTLKTILLLKNQPDHFLPNYRHQQIQKLTTQKNICVPITYYFSCDVHTEKHGMNIF